MEKIQFIGIEPTQLKNEIAKEVTASLLPKLSKEFQPKEPTEYLTRHQVRELLKVDLSTVHNWTKKDILIAYGIGSRVYYKRKEVESAIVKP